MKKLTIKLNKDDLITLVLGSSPYYSLIEEFQKIKLGSWCGGFVDKWSWDINELIKLSEEELYNVYIKTKESWK